MKPAPFVPVPAKEGEAFVQDENGGSYWHRCRQRTLYADTDRSQVVYHANYLRYFEYGRASLMREIGYPYREIEQSGYVYPIIEVAVQYYRPLYYDDPMVIYTRPSELERVRLRFDYVITHEESGQIACKGFTRHCAVNASGTPVEVDEKTASIWEKFPQ
jgi:acyl-CoA thioester hydrolase